MNRQNLPPRVLYFLAVADQWPEGWARPGGHTVESTSKLLDMVGDDHQFTLLPDNPADKAAPPRKVDARTWREAAPELLEATTGVYVPELGRTVRYGAFFTLGETTGRSRRKETMGAPRVLAADFDHKDGQLPPEKWPLLPSAKVFSGGGTHAYWKIKDPENCSQELFVELQRAIAARLGSDPAVAKATQIMRVPILNNKRDVPRACHVEWVNDMTYTVDQLCAVFLDGASGPSRRPVPSLADDVTTEQVEAIPLGFRLERCRDRLWAFSDTFGHDFFRVACTGHDYGVPKQDFFEMVKEWAAKHLWHRQTDNRFTDDEIAEYVNEAYKYAKRAYGAKAAEAHELHTIGCALAAATGSAPSAPVSGVDLYSDSLLNGAGGASAGAANGPVRAFTAPVSGVDLYSDSLPGAPYPEWCASRAGGSIDGVPVTERVRVADLAPGSVTRVKLNPGARVADNVDKVLDYDGAEGVITFSRAPLGAGKTHWAAKMLEQYATALAVASHVALTQNLAERYSAGLYSDKGGPEAKRVATTLKSLTKVNGDPAGTFKTHGFAREGVILDEADDALQFLFTALMDNPSATKAHLLWALAAAKHGIVTSADLTEDVIQLFIDALRKLRPDLRFVILEQDPDPKRTQRVIEWTNVGDGLARFYEAVDNHRPGDLPIVLAVTSAAAPMEIARAIKLRHRQKRVFACSSRNSKRPEIQAALRHPDQIVADHDVIITSPSIQSGVSFDAPVGKVFVQQSYEGVHGRSVCQMAMRFRNVADPRIVWGTTLWNARNNLPEDAFTLRRNLLGYADKTDDVVSEAKVAYELDFDRTRRPTDPVLLDMRVLVQREQNRMRNDPRGVTYEAMLRHGWKVADQAWRDPDKARLKAWKRVRGLGKKHDDDDYVRGVMEAEKLTFSELDRIEAQPTQTADEESAVQRTKIETFYGQKADDELIRRDDRGKWRRRVQQYVDVRCLDDHDGRRFLYWREAQGITGRSVAEYRHSLLKTQLLAGLVRALEDATMSLAESFDVQGFGVGGPSQFALAADKAAEVAWRYHQEHAESFRVLFRSVLSDETKAVHWLNGHMRRMGAIIETKRDLDANRTYYYDFTQAHQDGAHEFANAVNTARSLARHGCPVVIGAPEVRIA